MKKSNKLLLGILLTTFLTFLAVHVALYANFKSGSYTVYKEKAAESMITHLLPKVRYVSIRNVHTATVSASNTSAVQFTNKADEAAFHFRMQQDTLVVTRRDTADKNEWNGTVLLQVSDSAVINTDQSSVVVRGRSGTAQKSSFIIHATNGNLTLDTENGAPFESLTIDATDKAELQLGNAKISKLTTTLKDATIKEEGATIGSIAIDADTASHIFFTGTNFLKAKTAATHD